MAARQASRAGSSLLWRAGGGRCLLMSEIEGEHGASDALMRDPERLVRLYAEGLKAVHSVSAADCPFDRRLRVKMDEARIRAESGLVDSEDFEEAYRGRSPFELLRLLEEQAPVDEDLVFTHGDYCMPNFLVRDGRRSGFIDWAGAGIADRYQDLALAVRSLRHNGLGDYAPLFAATYGLPEFDPGKVEFYILLDEFF
ncbi:APH(3') family aminoglycoside O-phosphotransferase [Cohnella thermotolerans]|uniref:APH(3') family aminoglycoside O-phosphotransferase n=1 Tax=Cohnella thermotolerans TaxID=329858 RepID=UPI003083FAF0